MTDTQREDKPRDQMIREVPVPMWGLSAEADFEKETWTFQMQTPGWAVSAGSYAIVYNDDWQALQRQLVQAQADLAEVDAANTRLGRDLQAARSSCAEREGKLAKHVQIGNTIFSAGCKWSSVIERAEREFEYQHTAEKEAARMDKVRAFREALSRPPALTALAKAWREQASDTAWHPYYRSTWLGCAKELEDALTPRPECAPTKLFNAAQQGDSNGKPAQANHGLPRSVTGGDRPDEHGQGAGSESRGGTGDRELGTGHGQAVGGDCPHAPSGRLHGADESHRQADDVLARQDGHSALRVRDGRLETFDPHPAPAEGPTPMLDAALDDVEEFLEDQEDVVDGADGEPTANKAMTLLMALRLARGSWGAAARSATTEPK